MTDGLDKGLSKELADLGLVHAGHMPFMVPGNDARNLGARCRDCGSRKVVYLISKPLGDLFPLGSYCYRCLLARCRVSKIIPYPIEEWLLDQLQADLRIPPGANPKYITMDNELK